MACSRRREDEIVHFVAAELSGPRAWLLRRHLRVCSACRVEWQKVKALRTELRALAAVPLPEDLERRIHAELANDVGRKSCEPHAAGSGAWRRRWPLPRLRLALAGTLILAAGAGVVQPALVAARAVERTDRAMAGVRSAHLVRWSLGRGGTREKESELWYQDGRWRVEGTGGYRIEICTDGKRYVYKPASHHVRITDGARPPGYEDSSGFTLTALLRDAARLGLGSRTRLLGETTLEGRRVRRLQIEPSGAPSERVLLLVDAATDLPIRWERQVEDAGQWITEGIGEAQFNQALASELFTPDFPKSARRIDLEQSRREWQRRLSRGMAVRSLGDRKIVVRNLQVNADGDVFLLYTAGRRGEPRDWTVELRDEFGTRYLAPVESYPYRATEHDEDGRTRGYVLDGADLEADWWVAAEPRRPWKPRSFTLTFRRRAETGSPRPRDGGIAAFTLRLARPGCVDAPDYLPLLALAPGGEEPEWSIREWAAETRARHYETGERNLERALQWQRRVVAMDEAWERSTGARLRGLAWEWFQVHRLYKQLGREEEARSALRRVRDLERRGSNIGSEEMREVLEREGLR